MSKDIDYEGLQALYSDIVRRSLPEMRTGADADRYLGPINDKINAVRPKNWAGWLTPMPAEIFGVTGDKQRVIYLQSGRFERYHATPPMELLGALRDQKESRGNASASEDLDDLIGQIIDLCR